MNKIVKNIYIILRYKNIYSKMDEKYGRHKVIIPQRLWTEFRVCLFIWTVVFWCLIVPLTWLKLQECGDICSHWPQHWPFAFWGISILTYCLIITILIVMWRCCPSSGENDAQSNAEPNELRRCCKDVVLRTQPDATANNVRYSRKSSVEVVSLHDVNERRPDHEQKDDRCASKVLSSFFGEDIDFENCPNAIGEVAEVNEDADVPRLLSIKKFAEPALIEPTTPRDKIFKLPLFTVIEQEEEKKSETEGITAIEYTITLKKTEEIHTQNDKKITRESTPNPVKRKSLNLKLAPPTLPKPTTPQDSPSNTGPMTPIEIKPVQIDFDKAKVPPLTMPKPNRKSAAVASEYYVDTPPAVKSPLTPRELFFYDLIEAANSPSASTHFGFGEFGSRSSGSPSVKDSTSRNSVRVIETHPKGSLSSNPYLSARNSCITDSSPSSEKNFISKSIQETDDVFETKK